MSEPVLPEHPDSESDAAWSEDPAADRDPDERLKRDRPPHHDRWLEDD